MFFFQKKPVVHLYTISWNEEYLLRHFFQHYDSWVDRYVFFDDGSDDATLGILKSHPKVEIRKFPRLESDSFVLAQRALMDNCWKESRGHADWVVVTDVDEFLYTKNMPAYLRACSKKGVTAIPALGYQMISRESPRAKPLTKQVRQGCPWQDMSKLGIFNPDEVQETQFSFGRHVAHPKGNIQYPEKDVLLNLHYKYLSFEFVLARYMALNTKLGLFDKEQQWGIQYSWSREQLKKDWDEIERSSATNILSSKYDPDVAHAALVKWWRPLPLSA